MQLIIVLGLIAKLASVSGDCGVGNTVNDFDFSEFTGTWYFHYYLPNDNDDLVECPIDNYGDPVGNVSALTTTAYDKREGVVVTETASVQEWDNTGFNVIYDTDNHWTGRMDVVAVDYKRYVIARFCSETFSGVLIYVAFRSPDPDEETQNDMKNALNDNDIDIKQLRSWNADRCLQIQ